MVLNKDSESSSTAGSFTIDEPTTTAEQQQQQEQPQADCIDITAPVAKTDKHLVHPAGVGAAVLGFLFGGPLPAALFGFAAAYNVRKENGWGDAARKLGKLTMSVQEKTETFEEKHHLGEKTTNGINKFCDDEEEKSVAFKTRAFLVSAWLAASNYTKENQLLERGVEETGKGLDYLGGLLQKSSQKKTKSSKTNSKDNNLYEEDLVFVSQSSPKAGTDPSYTEMVTVKAY